MQQYTYKAKDASGKIVTAEVDASSVREAAKLLADRKLFALEIKERKATVLSGNLDGFRRITGKDRVLFTRQLATLIKAGLPLVKAIDLLEDQTSNPKMLRVIRDLGTSLEGGSSLSQSLRKHKEVFSEIYISLVEAGEVSGELDTTLARLANQEEKTQTVNAKIRGAFTYPAVVLVVLIAVMALMVLVVLPQVGKMYTDLGKPMPSTTALLIGIAQFSVKFWYLAVIIIGGAVYGLRRYISTPAGRHQWDQIKLDIPLISPLLKKMYMARFARTLGSLVGSGVPVLQATAVTAKAINNVIIEDAIKGVGSKVKGGIAFSRAVNDSPQFLPMVGQMIAVGEQTGTIGDTLERVATYYEDEVDSAVANISTLIEPITMVVLGGMVAFLIAAVLLPIYGLVQTIH